LFRNRADAARQLAARLATYRGTRPLVLGVPRGAVPMARIIGDALEGDVDVVLVHKLRAPGHPEYAIGAVDETGVTSLTEDGAALGISAEYLAAEQRTQLEALGLRRQLYTPVRPPIDPAGRVVIIVDDGTATGASAEAAIRSVRARHPAKVVVAVGVAPPRAARRLAELADDFVCISTPRAFSAVGQFYADFSQVSDDEAIESLEPSSTRANAPGPRA
jgi:putative phosphoribosyl transferase